MGKKMKHILKKKIVAKKQKKSLRKEKKPKAIIKLKEKILTERKKIKKILVSVKKNLKDQKEVKEYIKTGIEGLDTLMGEGMPKGSSVLLAGGAGSGKTIMTLQIINAACKQGKKCLYMSFEESEDHLKQHMADFGWNPKEFENKGLLKIKRFNTFDITRSVDALLEKAKGELLIEVTPVILPQGFKPEILIVDSLSAIASAFIGTKEESYRIYIEQLFRFLENLNTTSFLITETDQMPDKFSTTGVEEFLADGVIILYSIKLNNIRQRAIEVLKMRGTEHERKIVAMRIIRGKGIEVYPDQEFYSAIEESESK